MSVERVRDFYEMAMADEKVRSELEQAISAVGEEKKLYVIADYAKQAGYEVTEEDVEKYVHTVYEETWEKNHKNSIRIQELDMEEMEAVPGGHGDDSCDKKGYCIHNGICWNAGHVYLCNSTARKDENCIFNDRCNHVINT